MKILQVNKAYFPLLGGIETVVQQLAEGFAARGEQSVVQACAGGLRSREYVHNGVRVRLSSTLARISSLPISPAFCFELLSRRADILQIHEPSLLAAFTCYAASRRLRRNYGKVVLWWHSDIVRQRFARHFYAPVLRHTLRFADKIIVATPKHIESSEFLREFSAKCKIIPFGVDERRFQNSPGLEAQAAKFKDPQGRPLALFVGRLVYYKGVQYLVEAMRELPEVSLALVGSGPLEPEIRRLAAKCPGNVRLMPHLNEQEYLAVLQACDMFVLPSVEKSEAFGIVQIEAMACGKPVITTDLPTGVTFVNQHGQTGWVVPARNATALAQALKKLAQDAGLRRRLGDYARQRVLKEFTLTKMVDETLNLYRQLLS
jgi:rhamnosyl/mannosyltransferase